ncbi:hypothetical protein [Actinomadura parmotrematis]|uniref:Uncharacterized protein n=1 Tax=Actinomadura parmotrematis TaxID=2864039 RepID=A0ABS7G4X0_9ACTN|nr:hypothetical protein [Actinomadura parmotrematis]MBW8487758.1 hypothetical protein [Actinomadura parmotrematis]
MGFKEPGGGGRASEPVAASRWCEPRMDVRREEWWTELRVPLAEGHRAAGLRERLAAPTEGALRILMVQADREYAVYKSVLARMVRISS